MSKTDENYVTCGSAIKLAKTEKKGGKYYLNSGGHRINAGSGQQLVTASPTSDSRSSLWVIREADKAATCTPGKPIAFGTKIRLTHMETGANLHSHNVRSPLTSQQEITAYGSEGEGDTGDNWIVNPARGSDKYWTRESEVFIQHVDTGKFLGCSEQATFSRNNCGRNCPVMNHLEAFGRDGKDEFTKWSTDIGIFLSV
jgi:dolichyl-phosphate-mannose--protein O-mannosyl transferase